MEATMVQGQTSQKAHAASAAVALGALGIVYGDIGTSPLYALRETIKAAAAGGPPQRAAVLGSVSLILWSLILVVAVKYAILILRADNRGEGGIVAMLALLGARHAPPRSRSALLLVVGLIGAALLYGDGAITPAISVLSAVEGLKLDAPGVAPFVVPLTIAILIGLFWVQRKGTGFIGRIFGPVMLVWFMDTVHVPRALRSAVEDGRLPGIDCDHLSYFISHEAVVVSEKKPGMAAWREEIFALMQRNAEEMASYLCVPARQVMEVGAEMEV